MGASVHVRPDIANVTKALKADLRPEPGSGVRLARHVLVGGPRAGGIWKSIRLGVRFYGCEKASLVRPVLVHSLFLFTLVSTQPSKVVSNANWNGEIQNAGSVYSARLDLKWVNIARLGTHVNYLISITMRCFISKKGIYYTSHGLKEDATKGALTLTPTGDASDGLDP